MKKGLFFCLFFLVAVSLTAQTASLSSVGALGASNLYLSYLAVGAVVDAHAHGAYEDEMALELVKSVARFVIGSQESLKQLHESGEISGVDADYVVQMLMVLDFLLKETEGFVKYMETQEEQWGDQFETYRQKAWEKIQELTVLASEE